MNLPAEREILIRNYLLGDLPQERLEHVEERLMTDNEFYEHLLLVEDELVDQYLGGELNRKDARRFESHFLCSPERHQKLRFARVLQKHVSMRKGPVPDPASLLQRFMDLFRSTRPAWGYALAALLLLNVSAGYWGLTRYRGLQAELRDARAEHQAAEEKNQELQLQAGQMSQNLRRVEAEMLGLSKETEDLRAGLPRPARAASLAALLLTPGFTRSGGGMPRFRIPAAGTELLEISLDMATNDYGTYRVRILTEGEEVMSFSGLTAEEDPEKIRLDFLVPVASLLPADYEVQLHGVSPRGDEYVDTYHFRAYNP